MSSFLPGDHAFKTEETFNRCGRREDYIEPYENFFTKEPTALTCWYLSHHLQNSEGFAIRFCCSAVWSVRTIYLVLTSKKKVLLSYIWSQTNRRLLLHLIFRQEKGIASNSTWSVALTNSCWHRMCSSKICLVLSHLEVWMRYGCQNCLICFWFQFEKLKNLRLKPSMAACRSGRQCRRSLASKAFNLVCVANRVGSSSP